MKDLIGPRLGGARKTILALRFFGLVLESFIIYVLSALAFTLLEKDIVYALIPAGVYFLARSIIILAGTKTLKEVVGKYPSLDERLQTAYDNRNESNLIIDRLLADVSKRLDRMRASSFLESKAVTLKVSMVLFLLFALLTVNLFHIKKMGIDLGDDLLKKVGDIPGALNGGDETMDSGAGREWERGNHSAKDENEKLGGAQGGVVPGYNEGPLPGSGGGSGQEGNDNIYGAPSSAMVDGDDISLEVHPEYGGEVEIRDVENGGANRPFTMPEDIASAGTPQQEPVEYEEVIRKYFEKLSREAET